MTTHYQPKQTQQQTNGSPNGSKANTGSPIKIIATALSSLKSDIEKTSLWDAPEVSEKMQKLENLVTTVEQKFKVSWEASVEAKIKADREKTLAIVSAIRQGLDFEGKLKVAVTELRQNLGCDRVLVYRFDSENYGVIMAEAMELELTPLLGKPLESHYFGADRAAEYFTTPIVVIDDTSNEEFTPQQKQLWNKLQIKSCLTVPLVVGQQVWGLLVVLQHQQSRHWQESESQLVYQIGAEILVHLQQSEYRWQLTVQPEQERILNNVLNRIRQSQNLDTLFRATCREVRQLLNTDRVSVFQFIPGKDFNEGQFIAEDLRQGISSELGNIFADSRFGKDFAPLYRQGRIQAVSDVYTSGLSECHIEQLLNFQIRANLIVPLMKGEELWGLLCIHQCTKPHNWQNYEIEFVKRVAAQFGIALDQAHYLEELHEKTERLAVIAEREKNFIQMIGKVGKSIAEQVQQLRNIESIFTSTTQQLRRLLKADRIAIYRFNEDWSGTFVTESVSNDWTPMLNKQMFDHHFVDDIVDQGGVLQKSGMKFRVTETYLQSTRGGHQHDRSHFVVDDIYQANFPECYIELLEQFEAKAYIIVPIFAGNKLWGLLSAYQNSSTRHWEDSEVNLLSQIANQFGLALLQSSSSKKVEAQAEQLIQVVEREKTLTKVIDKMRLSLDVNNIFKTTTHEVRQLLKAERVSVYQFRPDWSGVFVAESVASGWPKWVGPDITTVWEDTYLQETQGGRYRQNQKYAVENVHSIANDINNAGLSQCHVEMLEQMQIKAYIIVPIFVGDNLWGLLAAYQHSEIRQWDDPEINVVAQIGIQMGVALRQAKYLEQVKQQSEQLSQAAKREKEAKELLQQRAIQLLGAIQPTLKGDLTVRLPVTTDEVGTLADAYNNTLQALRKILIQVQTATEKVSQTSHNSGVSITELSQQAQLQYQKLSEALKLVQAMVNSTQAVAKNAALVEATVQEANQTVLQGDTAMNRTVDEIMAIRETVAKTGKKIKRLSESSQKISKAVNLIGNLATQTNLLALNAAIEATRAGEYGKGFAVVADEVRSLARQSAAATTEIEQLVQEIQSETGEVVQAIETGIQQVVEGTNLVNETRQNLNKIVGATAQIQDLVQGITQATQQETQQSKLVTEAMTSVAKIANRTSENSLQISSSFQELLVMAEDLQSNVGKFKLN
ncbi:GAF domain-containing protein [Phormidium sp. LEGE 05292]|uniref:GAF domain-containing protein n=1 Tax=[Phormidium] sp. LEGE 05292 TaxID=767427 RepID=UPI00187FB4DB|nr:GAF domain-containing protein [Phormidium sp. LEGE 05292]MBE9224627.1 GAF domain-containing protein [Phormidium sp. LEGE 05292]